MYLKKHATGKIKQNLVVTRRMAHASLAVWGRLKGTIHSLLGQTNQVAGMCKSMMMLIRRLTSVAIRFDAWEETRTQR